MEHEHHVHERQSEGSLFQGSPKMTFYFGLVAGIAIVSFIGFILTFSMLRSGGTIGSKNSNTAKVAGTTTNTTVNTAAPTNAAAAPTAAPTVADIKIKDTDYIRGNKDAKVTLVEYSDFECPYCAQIRPTLDKILEQYPNDVRLIYRQYPLSFHAQAQKAAEASECAAEQGKFWEMHDKLFDMNSAGTLSVANFKSAAGDLGLKQSQFDNCLDTGKYEQKVKNDETEGTQYGVQGTPATFVNGTLVSGAVPIAQFTSIIDAALAK